MEELTSEKKRINNDKNNLEIVQRPPDLVGGRFPVSPPPHHAAVWTDDSQVDCTILLELCGGVLFGTCASCHPLQTKAGCASAPLPPAFILFPPASSSSPPPTQTFFTSFTSLLSLV